MKLNEPLKKGKFVVTSEIHSPLNEETPELIKSLELGRGRVDGVTVPEIDLEVIVGDKIHTCNHLKQNRSEPIYQTTTREKNRTNYKKISFWRMRAE